MDVSTRKLRYFVAVAEELHFSRAAAKLYVAQQALSKQIRELEDAVGAQLLRRTTRSVELTPAGEVLLAAAREALATLDAGVQAAARTGRGEVGTLRLGFGVGAALELTVPITSAFSARYPGIRLELREYGFGDPTAGLGDGTADVAFVRGPTAVTGLELVPLFTEPLVLVVARAHRLAGKASVSVRELLDEPIVVGRSSDEVWRSFWTLDAYRDGTAARVAMETSSHTEELEVVATGAAISVTTAAAARYTPHGGLAYVPVTDIAGSTLSVGYLRGRRGPLIERFVRVAREVRARESATVALIEHPFTSAAPDAVPAQASGVRGIDGDGAVDKQEA